MPFRFVSIWLLVASVAVPEVGAQAPQLRAEAQGYPAGLIMSGQLGLAVAPATRVLLIAGYNTTDRRDWGTQDDETGSGPGFGLAARRYFGADDTGVHLGLRADLWFLDIDWQREAPVGPVVFGTTAVVVLQPTGQIGYTWGFAENRWCLDLTVALGVEINVRTEGEPVGEGAILLGGLGLSYQL